MAWLPKNTVLVPVDFSEQSLAAVATALELVDSPEGLHLVHVLAPIHPGDPGMIYDELQFAERRARIELLLAEKLGAAVEPATVHTPLGSPGAEIVRVAETVGANLIVMPSHGRTGLARLTLGSVAERVLRHAHCPVLVLRD
jgi:nucleotide-binding universal stress UspA family protein